MTAVFRRTALAITLEGDYFPFHVGFIRGPGVFRRPVLREYFHELLHFWQLIGSGFLTNLAAEEWQVLQRYESTGDATIWQSGMRQEFERVDDELGFSAIDLHEALCRFWDVNVLGPHNLLNLDWSREPLPLDISDESLERAVRSADSESYTGIQFDELIEGFQLIGDSYVTPYRVMRERCGSFRAAVLFPLLGYFAMQSNSPVTLFNAGMKVMLERDWRIPVMQVENAWRSIFDEVRSVCAIECYRVTGHALTPGWDVLLCGSFAGNAVYSWYEDRFRRPLLRTHRRYLDQWLSTPGDSQHRWELLKKLRPAVTLFHDGHWTAFSNSESLPLQADYDQLARDAASIDSSSRRLELARRVASLVSPVIAAESLTVTRAVWTDLPTCGSEDDLFAVWEKVCEVGDWISASHLWPRSRGFASIDGMKEIYRLAKLRRDEPGMTSTAEALRYAVNDPDSAVAAYAADELCSMLLLNQEARSECLSLLQRGIDTNAPFYAASSGLNLGVLVERDNAEAAICAYMGAIRWEDPDWSPKAAFNLALLYSRAGNLAGSEFAYAIALSFEHPDVDPRAALSLGLLLQEAGVRSGCRAALERAHQAGHPEVHPHVQRALWALDASERAGDSR